MLFYETKIVYQRQTADATPNNVNETYLVEGINLADVETRLLDELRPYMFGETETPACKKAQYYDIIPSTEGEHWYKARVDMITVEDSGKEKRKRVSLLVEAGSIADAVTVLTQKLNTVDCEIVSVTRSPILDVFRAV